MPFSFGPLIWITLAVVNIPVYIGIGWLLFKDWDEFVEAIKFWLTPDAFSFVWGNLAEDWWAEVKLAIWFGACIGCVLLEAFLISRVIH